MKNLRTKLSYTLYILLACVFMVGCNPKHEGKIVKDAEGKLYRLDHRIGVVYALEEISVAEIDSLNAR